MSRRNGNPKICVQEGTRVRRTESTRLPQAGWHWEGAGGQGSQTPAPPRSGRRKVLKVARPDDQCGDLRAPRRSHPTAPAASCRTHTNLVAPISLSVPTSRFRSTPKWGLAYSTSAGVGECPLTVADRQGQVAHTRGSGETVATSPSDEEQMAIIFRCSILGDSLLALKRRRNPVRLDFIDL